MFRLEVFQAVEKTKKENPPKHPVAAPLGHPKKPAKSRKTSSGHLVRKRGKGGQMAELSSVSLLIRKFNLLV